MVAFELLDETLASQSITQGDSQGQLILNSLFYFLPLLQLCKDLGLPLSAFRGPPDLTHCSCSTETGDPSSAVGSGHADLAQVS